MKRYPNRIFGTQQGEKFIAMRTYFNNLIMHLKLLEKQEQSKPKVSSWKEIINIRLEINEIETF
jgi:hypothetical protein